MAFTFNQQRRSNYSHVPVGVGHWHSPTGGPGDATNIAYANMGMVGPYGPKVQTTRGSWHSPTGGGPNYAAMMSNLGMQSARNQASQARNRGRLQRNNEPRRRVGGGRSGGLAALLSTAGTARVDPLASARRRIINRMADDAFARADMNMLQKRYMGRGLSLGSGTQAAAVPALASALMDARVANNVQPLLDQMSDAQFGIRQRQVRNEAISPLLQMI